MGLENGYDTVVGGAGGHPSDDMALSGGQKQRVAIASAIAAACGSGQFGACFDS